MLGNLQPWLVFHRRLHLLVYRPRGILDETHVERTLAALDQIEQSEEEPFNRFSDLSRIDAVDLSVQFRERWGMQRKTSYANYPPARSAFYVTSPSTERLVREITVPAAGLPLEIKVFKQIEAAATWLGVPQHSLALVGYLPPGEAAAG
jgi:hypothetical protein